MTIKNPSWQVARSNSWRRPEGVWDGYGQMKKWLTKVAMGFIILCATVLLTKFWYLNPDSFPSSLRSIVNAIIDWLGVQSAERSADVELVYILFLSFLVVSSIFCGCLACWKRFYGEHDWFH